MLAEDDADQVVGAGRVVGVLHGGGDLVVGLGDDVGHVDAGGVVAESAEGVQASHSMIVFGGSQGVGLGGYPLPLPGHFSFKVGHALGLGGKYSLALSPFLAVTYGKHCG